MTGIDRGAPTPDSFGYDASGNMTDRTEASGDWDQPFNSENRMSSITDGTDTWDFTYDGDGNRVVQKNSDGTYSLFLAGGAYEVSVNSSGTTTGTRSYYALGGQRALVDETGDLHYLLTDHLGSVAAVIDDTGNLESEQRYLPFGGERLTPSIGETDFSFTGQRGLNAFGLVDFKARFYSPGVGRFMSPDTIVPDSGNPQAWDRFSYTYNNPLRYADPSGNIPIEGAGFSFEEKYEYVYTDPLDDVLSITSHGKPRSPIRDDPPPPPDPEEVFEFVFYDIPQWIANQRFDAIGGRLNFSFGAVFGFDAAVDVLLNFRAREIDIFFAGGGQAYSAGIGVAIGPLFAFNLADNAGYEGWSAGPELTLTGAEYGGEAAYNIAFEEYKGERPSALFIGWSGGAEMTVGGNVTYTFSLDTIVDFIGFGP